MENRIDDLDIRQEYARFAFSCKEISRLAWYNQFQVIRVNYFQGLTNAIEYVEEHILEAIDFDQASQCAGMSRSSFQRFFLLVADMTFSEYVRQRRMDGAVFDLCNTDERIIDIAAKYCYDSAAAFSRSVKKLTGMKPSEIRQNGSDFCFPKLSIKVSLKGGELIMNKTPIVKIEEHHKEKVIAFRVDCENPESAAWGLMSEWCIENMSDRTGRRYVGFASIGHHPNGAPHQNASELETHPYIAMMFLIGDECKKEVFHGLQVEEAPEGLFLVNDVVLNQYDENGDLDIALSMMKASESFVEFMNKTDQYEFDCGKGIFFEEHIFSERWFEQGGVPDGFRMWVPILKK